MDWEQQGTGSIATIQLGAESHPRVMRLAVPGRHMALNALGALLAATQAGADVGAVLDGLASFEGVRRRFESVGTAAGVRVFDDYAHHPTEVHATLEALRAVAGQGRSIVVFQPHLYSRTQTFAREFGQALSLADEVVVLDVYAAREQPIPGVSGASVAEHVTVAHRYVPHFSAVAELVAASARPGDVVVTMGAGDVTLLGREILLAVQARARRDGPGSRPS
jgi:UDP-N-acetylmuramate--alanine ligase